MQKICTEVCVCVIALLCIVLRGLRGFYESIIIYSIIECLLEKTKKYFMFLSGDGCGGNRCADQHPAIAIKGLFFQMLTDERDFQVGDKICLGVKDLEMEGGDGKYPMLAVTKDVLKPVEFILIWRVVLWQRK